MIKFLMGVNLVFVFILVVGKEANATGLYQYKIKRAQQIICVYDDDSTITIKSFEICPLQH